MTIVNVTPPSISGTTVQGNALHANPGTWTSDDPLGPFAYQWERCDGAGANCVEIPDAISSGYILTAADVGHTMRVRVTATVAPSPPPAGYIYSLGASFTGDGTDKGWVRQGYAPTLAQRVFFDDSVAVMQSASSLCHTVRCEIRPNDLDANGGTSNQRAQVIGIGLQNYGGQPSITPVEGQSYWYGTAFTTNAGYVPHYDAVFGGFNAIWSWHDSAYDGTYGPLAPIMTEITTIASAANPQGVEDNCGINLPVHLGTPLLHFQLNGGDKNAGGWPNNSPTVNCLRYYGPPFVAGQLYRMEMFVKWGAHMDGELQIWVDGTKYVDKTGISNMWYSGAGTDDNMFPVFENYRAYDNSLPTNIIYYGGLIRGATRADVIVP